MTRTAAGRAGAWPWLAALLVVGGCAQRGPAPLYHWGRYPDLLYAHFKADSSDADPGTQLQKLQAEAERAQLDHQALPPGLRAHLGLMHLRLGRLDPAATLFEDEKAAFPESAPFMDFLLRRMRPASMPASGPAP